jgi:hypothetical protein
MLFSLVHCFILGFANVLLPPSITLLLVYDNLQVLKHQVEDEKDESCPQERLVLVVCLILLYVEQGGDCQSLQESKLHPFVIEAARPVYHQHWNIEEGHNQK